MFPISNWTELDIWQYIHLEGIPIVPLYFAGMRPVVERGGQLIMVVPNRRGIWARVETTPFGHGRPYSRGQVTTLLRDTGFEPIDWSQALAVPPISRRLWLRSGAAWERIGTRLWPAFSGVIIVDACKELQPTIPAKRKRIRAAATAPALAPAPAAGE